MTMSSYHQPVLLADSVRYLVSDPDGVYVDVTYGGGGHSQAILDQLSEKGRLFGFDQDIDAQRNIIQDDRMIFVQSNFSYIRHFLEYYGITEVTGVIADLGVSSHHFDDEERGFSYRFDSELDMRMNQLARQTAADVLNTYGAADLQRIFSEYGEIRNSRSLAQAIVEHRLHQKIHTVVDLEQIIDRLYRGDRIKYTAQVYQSLRIEVNDELGVLKDMLLASMESLASGGRLVVISYHSLEDKLVKLLIRDNNFEKKKIVDEYGRSLNVLKPISKKPIIPSEEEIKINSRAASAKMRVAEKL